jgi:hypothetical protein
MFRRLWCNNTGGKGSVLSKPNRTEARIRSKFWKRQTEYYL